jgi:gamma-glutamyltranspeptidase/glutathione hydrolase
MAGKILEGFGPHQGGLITREDLETYQACPREPLEIPYRGRKVYTNPPPSSGGCLAAFLLKLLEGHDLASIGYNTPAHARLLMEAMRVTDEARREDFDHRIFEEGMAGEFLGERNMELYRKRLLRVMEGTLSHEKPGAGSTGSAGSTTHISVVDGEGNAASVTTSTGIGSGFMIPGTGMMMNNFLGEEDLNPRGFHTERPGTGISSMMAPTIVMNGERPEIVLGTGGSKRIRNVIVQVILNVIDHGMGVAQAVDAPRVHWDGAVFHIEPGVGEDVAEALRADGVKVNVWVDKEVYFGGVNAVCTDPSGVETGGADPRRGGVWMQVE